MGFFKDFKTFALKGNVLDLAVGVIIGGAFGKIVTALVDDLIMPVIGLANGGKKFDDNYTVLSAANSKIKDFTNVSLEEAKKAGANIFAYGHFIQSVVDFLIIAFCIFIMVRSISRLYKKNEPVVEPAKPAEPTQSEKLLVEIRDLLKTRGA